MNPSCIHPQIEDKENDFDTNSEFKIMDKFQKKYKKNYINEEIETYSNKSFSFNIKKKYINKNSKLYIDKVKCIQKFVRFYLSIKKFNEHLDLLTNILELDSSVNVIKDKKTQDKLLMINSGEQLSLKLIKSGKIPSYTSTRYYRLNIKKYKLNRCLLKTPLTYIDKYKNNDLYIGTWTLEKKFHGYGVFYTSGNKYEGFWNFGQLSGEGRKFYQNKDYYLGGFVDGKSNGFGRYYHSDGTVYEGNWLNDQPHGAGKEIFSDSSKFIGIFENGYKRKGKFTWVDGSYYDGEIKNNVFEGYGKFRWKEGREYTGFWKNGKMHGKGYMNYVDGAKYEGEFLDGKRNGKGNYYWNKNKYYKGYWVKGKQEGDGYYFNRGKGIIGVWKDGKMKQCLSQEINQELLFSKIQEERPHSPSEKSTKIINGKNEYYYDSFNNSTNLSYNSMRDIRLNKRPNERNKNKINNKNDSDQKYQTSKIICDKKNINDCSVISDYSTYKPKVTNIEVLFKSNSSSSRSKKSIISSNIDNNSTFKKESYYKKYKKKK